MRKIVILIAFTCNFSLSIAQTQLSMSTEACNNYQQVDEELNSLYKQILKDTRYSNNKPFLSALKTAQTNWIKFRDASIDAKFPGLDKKKQYGSVLTMCSCAFLTELTLKRIDELKIWIQGTPEGDVCAGSVKNQ